MDFRSGTIRLPTPILVVGLGLTGKSVLRLLKVLGVSDHDVISYDDKDPGAQIKSAEQALKLDPKTLIVSPGFPLATVWIQDLRKKQVVITSELELASNFLKREKIVAVTGSVGKSTVVAILGQGLGHRGFVGGNFGNPLADYICDVIQEKRTRVDWIVLELSSYQLENFPSLRADGAIITSLTPNHLERYKTQDDYYRTKLTLISKCVGPIVFNHSGFDLIPFVRKYFGDSKHRARFTSTDRKDPIVKSVLTKNKLLLGAHNRDNLAVCVRLAQLLDWPSEVIEGFFTFAGLPHRLENLGRHHGAIFINDSKATTIASVLQAVQSLKKQIGQAANFHLLLGGKDKNLPWQDLKGLKRIKNAQFYFFGDSAEKAQRLSALPGKVFPKLSPALKQVLSQSKKDDLVLLSPGGTSLDEFKSFEDRGQNFKKEIEQWSHGRRRPE